MMKKIGFLLLMGICAPLFAAESGDAKAIRESLGQAMPGMTPDSIKASPLPGVYEVTYGAQLYYVSADGRYLFTGDMVDVKEKTNLSEERRSGARAAAISKLGGDALVYPAKGKTKHVINVFTDIDCGYCRKLHSGMKEMNDLGIEVRYLAFPRAGVGSPSYDKAVSVWCAKDRKKAMDAAKGGEDPQKATCKNNPVAQQLALGESVGVQGTPAIVLEDGRLVPGYMPPQRLLQMLEQNGKQTAMR